MGRTIPRAALAGLLSLLLTASFILTASPVAAHWPEISAESRCDAQGRPWIDYESWSWKQDPTRDGQSGNPNIGIYINGAPVDRGSFSSANGYQFAGTILASQWAGKTVTVRAQADAPFNNGVGLGSFRETSVLVPDDCGAPRAASVSVLPGPCRFDGNVSWTTLRVTIEPASGAMVTIRDQSEREVARFTESGSVAVVTGSYIWRAVAADGFVLAGPASGELAAGTCEPTADRGIGKDGPSGTVLVGDTVAFTITVTNDGPSAEPNAIATDTLPASFVFRSVTPSQGACTEAAGVISCELGILPVGKSAVIVVAIQVTKAGRYTNVAVVTGQRVDQNPANDRAEEVTDVFEVLPTTSTSTSTTTTTTASTTTTTTSSTTPATTTTPSASGTSTTGPLPFTGRDNAPWAGAGFSLVALGGLILLAVGRRDDEPGGVWIGNTWRSSRPRNTINLLVDL